MGSGYILSIMFIGVILLFFIVGAAAYLWYALTPRRAGATVPSCGKCNYPVAGLSAMICPECGSDLLAVGIVAPRGGRVRGSLVLAILSLTSIVFFSTLMVTLPLTARLRRASAANVQTVHRVDTYAPADNSYRSLDLTLDATQSTWNVGYAELNICMTGLDGRRHSRVFVMQSGMLQIRSDAGQSDAKDTISALRDLLTAAGAAEPEVHAVAIDAACADLLAQGSRAANTPLATGFVGGSTSLSVTGGTMPAYYGLLAVSPLVVGLAVWSLGIWWIVRRRRRLAEPAASGSALPTPA